MSSLGEDEDPYERERLRRCIRDLAGLLALPSMTRGRSPRGVLDVCLDALLAAVPVELAYARALVGEADITVARCDGVPSDPRDVVDVVDERLARPPGLAIPIARPGKPTLRTISFPLHVAEKLGVLLVGSSRPGFPTEEETVLLRAASSLTASTIDHASLMERARDAEQRKDDFLALLGHELRNPLAPIVTALALIAQRAPEIERERAVIEPQVQHMIRLVDDLLDVSRITRGKLDLRPLDVSMATVVRSAVEMIEPVLERRDHTLQVEVEEGLTVHGDPGRLAQAIANLLHNAARYTDPGGTVRLTAVREGGFARITVSDDGIGIAPELLGSIWDPFVQVARRTERSTGGLGLGLALVKNIVELHGGTVSAHSGEAGHGSTFTISVPAIDVRASIQPPCPATEPPASGAHRRVLVVDDNEDAAEMMRDALEADGYVVTTAYDGPRALHAIRNEIPDIAILDIGLPVMDGYELAGHVHRLAPATRLIALTGYGTDRDRALALAAGFHAHLVKPVNVTDLHRALAG